MENKREKTISEEIGRLARRIRRLTAQNDQHLSRMDTLKILLLDNEGVSLRGLARIMDVRPPSLSEWIDKLMEEGLVLKERDENDKRLIKLMLSPKGKEEALILKDKYNQPGPLAGALSEAEEEQFFALCLKLNEVLDCLRKEHHENQKGHMNRHSCDDQEGRAEDDENHREKHSHGSRKSESKSGHGKYDQYRVSKNEEKHGDRHPQRGRSRKSESMNRRGERNRSFRFSEVKDRSRALDDHNRKESEQREGESV